MYIRLQKLYTCKMCNTQYLGDWLVSLDKNTEYKPVIMVTTYMNISTDSEIDDLSYTGLDQNQIFWRISNRCHKIEFKNKHTRNR